MLVWWFWLGCAVHDLSGGRCGWFAALCWVALFGAVPCARWPVWCSAVCRVACLMYCRVSSGLFDGYSHWLDARKGWWCGWLALWLAVRIRSLTGVAWGGAKTSQYLNTKTRDVWSVCWLWPSNAASELCTIRVGFVTAVGLGSNPRLMQCVTGLLLCDTKAKFQFFALSLSGRGDWLKALAGCCFSDCWEWGTFRAFRVCDSFGLTL